MSTKDYLKDGSFKILDLYSKCSC